MADAAGHVFHSARTWSDADISKQMRPNLERLPMLTLLHADGSASFSDGRTVDRLDSVIYCTGYKYKYRLLEHLNFIRTGVLLLLFGSIACPSGLAEVTCCSDGVQTCEKNVIISCLQGLHATS